MEGHKNYSNQEIQKSLNEVLHSTKFIKGPEVGDFEKDLEEYLGVNNAIACGSGTDALQIALMSLELSPGDEIITTDFTFAATIEVILLLGLKPILVDIDPKTFNIDSNKAKEALTPYGDDAPLLIAVTVLTSMSENDLRGLGITKTPAEQVNFLANLTKQSGLDGVVCSAWEAEQLKLSLGKEFKLITPGIRPAGSAKDDQQRIMTPEQAINVGVDYLVIGRPITKASDPQLVLEQINASIS